MKRITNAEKKQIAEVLIEYLQNCEDGLDITTYELMRECGYEPGDFDELDLMRIHDALFKAAGKAGLELDMSAHDGLFEGLPQNLDFIVHHLTGHVRCPKCGSTNVARILYGMPAFSEELEKELEEGKIVLGGCLVRSVPVNGEFVSTDAVYRCNECGKEFGTPPLLIAKDYSSAEDYRDIVREIRFVVGGFLSDWKKVTIRKTDKGAHAEWDEMLKCRHNEREMTKKEWETLLDDLYAKIYLHEWKKNYNNPYIFDGEQWNLSLKLTKGRVRNYYGSNDYPPYWDALLKLLAY